jgi:hypothetical protein
MFITKTSLPRRTFLRGLGVSIALPMLDAMVPALTAKSAIKPAKRLGFVYLPNGVAMSFNNGINYWKPTTVGEIGDLPQILAPFAAIRDRMTVVSGLTHYEALPTQGDGGNGDHTRGTSTWLNGAHTKHTQGADVEAGKTADQYAAEVIGKDTPLPSLELGIDVSYLTGNCDNGYSCVYVNTLSWLTPTTPMPTETNPRIVFEKLFGEGGTPAQRLARIKQNQSILDWVGEEMARIRKTVGPSDRTKLNDYFDSVREIESRIQRAESRQSESVSPAGERPTGVPVRYDEHAQLMFDLQWTAFRGDMTRVFTFMLGREISSRAYPEIGVSDAHHGLSHHEDKPEKMARYAKCNTFHAQQVAYFMDKLASTPDGDGTLLDGTTLLFGAGLSDGNAHGHRDQPMSILGGTPTRHKGGQHIVMPMNTPACNLLLSVLDKGGVHLDKIGDSTGRIAV